MIEIRTIERHEVGAFRQAFWTAFGTDATEAPSALEAEDQHLAAALPLANLLAAFDGERLVATLGWFEFDLAVPGDRPGRTGSPLRTAGVSMVSVASTHRRRGLLTALMSRHLATVADRGFQACGLRASEETIYGRFGFGPATPGLRVHGSLQGAHLPPGPPDVRLDVLTAAEAADVLPPVAERIWRTVPGFLRADTGWWHHSYLRDAGQARDGASPRRIIVARRGAEVVGWTSYRQRPEWADGVPRGRVEVTDLMAEDDDARRALWHHIAGIDLHPEILWEGCPADDPVVHEVDRFRRLGLRLRDSLWLHLLDPAAALQARGYEQDGTVRLSVRHPGPATAEDVAETVELRVEGGVGRCRPVDGVAEVTLEARALGAAYLGGVSVRTLARAGRVTGDADAVLRLDRLLRTSAAPWSPQGF